MHCSVQQASCYYGYDRLVSVYSLDPAFWITKMSKDIDVFARISRRGEYLRGSCIYLGEF